MKPVIITPMRTSFYFLLLLSSLQHVAAECYFPNGTLNKDLETQPCNRYEFSTCCSNNKTTVGQPFPIANDVCNPNGLCQNWQTEGSKTYVTWWRAGCSDPTWNSPYCLKDVCFDQPNGSAILSNCTDNTFCCGFSVNNPYSCCKNASATFKIAATIGATSSTSSTQSPTSSTPADADTKHGNSSKVKVGVGVGVPLGVLALVALVAGILYWRRRKRRTQPILNGKENSEPGAAELATEDARAELEHKRVPVEAAGTPISELP